MVTTSTIATVDLVLGSIATLGLLYLLYSETLVVHYRRFFRLITLGLLIYAVTGPIIGTFAPAYIHTIHGIAALCIALGLFALIQADLHHEVDLSALLDTEDLEPDTAFEFIDDSADDS